MRTLSQKEAYSNGYQAYLTEQVHNPYDGESLKREWENGWTAAMEDDKEWVDSQSPLREEEMDGSYGEQDH